MKISTKGRYGLRILADIALHQADGPVKLADISRRQDISIKYVWQVIHPLTSAGLLRGRRGANGGYTLGRDPETITMLDVVSVLEGAIAVVDCLADAEDCVKNASCVTRSVWETVNDCIKECLAKILLSDVVERYRVAQAVDNYVI